MRNKLIFATMVCQPEQEQQALLLAAGIRAWAGSRAKSPIWIMTPEGHELADDTTNRLTALKARLVPFAVDTEVAAFPSGAKVLAGAAAETEAEDKTDVLVWMAPDTLVLQEPASLLLPKDKSLACCPVHRRLIGAPWDEPMDIFWQLVYLYCRLRDTQVFAVRTLVDGEKIRPYFDAGLLAVRPQMGVLRAWSENVRRHYQREPFQLLYKQDERNALFMHQAVLSATALSMVHEEAIEVLGPRWNYPLHLHDQVSATNRAGRLNDLITCRYEDIALLAEGNWRSSMDVRDPLAGWLAEQLLH